MGTTYRGTETHHNDLNLSTAQRVSVALTGVAVIAVIGAVFQRELLVLALLALIGVGVLNYALYAFFFRQHGLLFACFCVPLHFLYCFCSGLSYGYVLVDTRLRGRQPRQRAAEQDSRNA